MPVCVCVFVGCDSGGASACPDTLRPQGPTQAQGERGPHQRAVQVTGHTSLPGGTHGEHIHCMGTRRSHARCDTSHTWKRNVRHVAFVSDALLALASQDCAACLTLRSYLCTVLPAQCVVCGMGVCVCAQGAWEAGAAVRQLGVRSWSFLLSFWVDIL